MKNLFKVIENRFKLIASFFVLLILIAFFDKILAIGLIFLAILFLITYLILKRLKIGGKKLFWLCVIAFIVHLLAVVFIYYTNFYPFGGGAGGFKACHIIATEISQNFRAGNFSFENVYFYEIGEYPYRHYALVVGLVYTITGAYMLIGQLFGVWLAVMTVLLVYLLVKEIGGSEKWAFLVGLLVAVYPSQLYYSSILLKDGMVTLLSLISLLFAVKLIKKFSLKQFFIFYIALGLLTHFRFYAGYALLIAFLISWIILYRLKILKKIVSTLLLIVLLGILPEIFAGMGFFGAESFTQFFAPETMAHYQEKIYYGKTDIEGKDVVKKPPREGIKYVYDESWPINKDPFNGDLNYGHDSTWEKEKLDFSKPWESLANYSKYFTYILLGPFPWQITHSKHYFSLLETIPLIFLMLLVIYGIFKGFKRRNKSVFLILLFSILFLGVITLFVSNYGIITRIRIPAIVSLLCLIPLGFKKMELMKIYD